MKEGEQKKDKYFQIITILLIIIIIILLFFSRFGKINNYPVPTGNVVFFDIDVNVDYTDVPSEDKNESSEISENKSEDTETSENKSEAIQTSKNKSKAVETSENNYNIGKEITRYNTNTDQSTVGRVFVDDKSGDYIYQQNLNIFNNSAYQYTNKIAPGVSNTYHFVVHNSSNINLKYYVEMYEDSEYQVNLKYRLKRNNNYIIGNDNTWVTADE